MRKGRREYCTLRFGGRRASSALSLLRAFRRLTLLALLLLPAAASAQQEKQFNAATFTLSNGLQVVVIENHRAPIVTQMVWYKVGSADQQRGKTGIAHFLDHLIFKATNELPTPQFSPTITHTHPP